MAWSNLACTLDSYGPVLEHACPFYMAVFLSDQIEQIQRRSVKMISSGLSYIDGLEELNLSTLVDCGELLCKRFHGNNFGSSSNIEDLLPKKNFHSYNFRNARNIPLF